MSAPTVTSLNPSTGPAAGGTAVLITGTVFSAATAVSFGGATAGFTIISATQIVATAPAHAAEGVNVTVSNADGTSTDVATFTYASGTVLFTLAEARNFDKRQLSNTMTYSDADIIAKEAEIRSSLESYIGVAFSATSSTEYYDGDGTSELYLYQHNPFLERPPRGVTLTSVTVIDTDDTETAFTADELSDVVKYPDKLVRRSGTFTSGYRNIKVVYVHGYTTVPADIKNAALQILKMQPPFGLVPSSTPSYAVGGTEGGINWTRVVDIDRGRFYGDEAIDSVIRYHRSRETLPGIV